MLLKRSVEVLVGAALVALMLAVLPAVAEAKEGAKAATHEEEEAAAQSAKRGADATHAAHAVVVVVVRPGDSLWSISEEHLGPNATAQRIARKTERLWALNRERIGADPNLILVGQELLVPSVGESSVGESSASSPSSTTGSPAEGEATRRGQTTHTQERATEANKAGQAPEQAPQRVTLPEAADAQPVPAARPPLSDPISDPTSNDSSSPTLAVALVAWALLTVVLALVTWVLLTTVVLLALWALRVAEGRREASKIRHLRAVFGTNYTSFDPLLGFEETLRLPESETDEAVDNNPDRLGLLATARIRGARIQHGRMIRGGRLPGGGLTTAGVYNPNIRRYLLGATRPRRVNPKGSSSLTVAPSVRRTRGGR